jgi:hypothetical protein
VIGMHGKASGCQCHRLPLNTAWMDSVRTAVRDSSAAAPGADGRVAGLTEAAVVAVAGRPAHITADSCGGLGPEYGRLWFGTNMTGCNQNNKSGGTGGGSR